jgi:hypothetical protein
MAVGLTNIVTSVIKIILDWAETGKIHDKNDQKPVYLFVDCSNGVNRDLRALAEQSVDDLTRQIALFPVVLMALRLLDHSARYNTKLRKLDIQTQPYATSWLNLLGDLLHHRREEAELIMYHLGGKAVELSERLQEEYPEAATILVGERDQPNPVWRLAEVLTFLQGRKNTQNNVVTLLDSALLVGRPNGLAARRTVLRKVAANGQAKRSDVRSLIFTDSVLDYLVHLHVLPTGFKSGYRPLSFKRFLEILRERYGFCVDQSPQGMTISNDFLRLNHLVLERRLRDLGLLVGVNDAESMKQLIPRFQRLNEHHDAN